VGLVRVSELAEGEFLLFLVGSVLIRIGSVRCPGSKVCLSMALSVRS
jgi:hypothetical protein